MTSPAVEFLRANGVTAPVRATVDLISSAAVRYAIACGAIYDVENCSAFDEFVAAVDGILKSKGEQ